METAKYVIGVDIGNTKTTYVLAGVDGQVIAVHKGPGANYQEFGAAEMVDRLKSAVTAILDRFEISTDSIGCIYYGAAGADTPQDFETLANEFAKVCPGIPYDFENDGWIALHSGTRGAAGMVVTFGTGNTNFAVNSGGERQRIGGLNEYLGDEIGAYLLARKVMNASMRSEDLRDDPTILSTMIPEAFGLNSTSELINHELNKDNVKEIIEVFFQAAQKGDGLALTICWSLVKEVLKIVRQFYYTLFQQEDSFTLVLEGTVFKQRYQPFTNMLELALNQRYNLQIVIPDYDPVVGAVFLALQKEQIAVDKSVSDKVIQTFIQKVQK